ncbi:unnamed protein product [Phaedon cochleariae]|uniref:Transposase domain-containing protein n=1 Tax=Phaedon cochleariae TaxID=80249 RepID=A0A9N9X1T5_PHACE|nr:unnamed protein product [Phaedon cochleariae]
MSFPSHKKFKTSTWYRCINSEVDDVLNSINFSNTPVCATSSVATTHIHELEPLEEPLELDICDLQNLEFESNNTLTMIQEASSLPDTTFPNPDNPSTLEHLRYWAVKNKIPHVALAELLIILQQSGSSQFESLPKDPRTFLRTSRITEKRLVHPGYYCHIGLRNSIEKQYERLNLLPSGKIKVGINIDGLPLAKSTSSQVYPILCINESIPCSDSVSLVGIYHGYDKPSDFNDFLREFVTEAVDLTNNGITLFGKQFSFEISMYLFDAVAKASVLFIKGHSGYSSCTKCFQKGEFINDRICFPELTFCKRTHESFIEQSDQQHHTGHTILSKIPNIDLINDIPLDYMHLVLLGVVKKLLCGIWCFGSPPHKWSYQNMKTVSEHLESLSTFMPSEFARKPRGLKEVKRWKATEFRQFLFYTGPIVLKNSLPKTKYEHFMILSVSIIFLISEKYCHNDEYLSYANSLLTYFVDITKSIYGSHFLTHNFHNLLHLSDDHYSKFFGIFSPRFYKIKI